MARRPRILVLGLPYFGRLLQDALRERGLAARYVPHPGRDPRGWARLLPLVVRADLIYLISSRVDRWSPQAMLAALRPGPIVIHWVGTDVLIALGHYRAGQASRRLLSRAVHLADAPWLVDELREMGIAAAYVPLPVAGMERGEPPPLPETFRVLLYYPVDPFDREVFDLETMMRLVREFPDTAFTLIPSPAETLPGPLPPNLEARGWVSDMAGLYREATVYVRLTSHDGTSFMAVEALSRGRHVIWTFPLRGAIRAAGFEAVSTALSALVARHDAGSLELNDEGRASVLEEFEPARIAGELAGRLRSAL